MALGKATVTNGNLAQGSTPGIEKKALFVGVGATNVNTTQPLNAQSDLDTVLGAEVSDIKTQCIAAQLEGGAGWESWVRIVDAADDWRDEVDAAMATVSPECIVLCTPVTSAAELNTAFQKFESLRTKLARRVFGLVATPGIDPASQTWAQYDTAQAAITAGVAAYRVAAVPQLHGNNVGVLAGRLCRRDLSVADTPMRVASGSLLALGPAPVDSDGVDLGDPTNAAILASLDSHRLSVPQFYPDYPGIYWADCNLLDVPGGDYQVIEHLRPADKIAREMRLIEISMIGDRAFNSSPESMAYTKNKLMAPLRRLSKKTNVNGREIPGEIIPPTKDSVVLVWEDNDTLKTYFTLRPVGSAKDINGYIYLDLRSPGSELP